MNNPMMSNELYKVLVECVECPKIREFALRNRGYRDRRQYDTLFDMRGEYLSYFPKYKSERSTIKIGRGIRRLLEADIETPFLSLTDTELEVVVNAIKSVSLKEEVLKVVDGEDIRKYYSSESYKKDSIGNLGTSCMRYTECSEFFDIYCHNYNFIKMLVSFDRFDCVNGRSLLWYPDGYSDNPDKAILDRSYGSDYIVTKMMDYARENSIFIRGNLRPTEMGDCSLFEREDECLYEVVIPLRHELSSKSLFPYMDTFKFLSSDGNLSNVKSKISRYILTSTSGGYSTIPICSVCNCADKRLHAVSSTNGLIVNMCHECICNLKNTGYIHQCEHCGIHFSGDVYTEYRSGNREYTVCRSCYNETRKCDICGKNYAAASIRRHEHFKSDCKDAEHSTTTVCQDCLEIENIECSICTVCGLYFNSNTEYDIGHNGRVVCPSCRHSKHYGYKGYYTCTCCGKSYRERGARLVDGRKICGICNRSATICVCCGESIYPCEEKGAYINQISYVYMHERCLDNSTFVCECCKKLHRTRDRYGDRDYCMSCYMIDRYGLEYFYNRLDDMYKSHLSIAEFKRSLASNNVYGSSYRTKVLMRSIMDKMIKKHNDIYLENGKGISYEQE